MLELNKIIQRISDLEGAVLDVSTSVQLLAGIATRPASEHIGETCHPGHGPDLTHLLRFHMKAQCILTYANEIGVASF